MRSILLSTLAILASSFTGFGADPLPASPGDVVWSAPGKNAADSMPIGNGDIGLNVWVEEGGDLRCYLSKTDAWCENSRLLKLGGLRVSLTPNPFAAGLPFQQALRLQQGAVIIRAGEPGQAVELTLWVDAHQPAVRLQALGEQPFTMTLQLEVWRRDRRPLAGPEAASCWHMAGAENARPPLKLEITPDTVRDDFPDRLVWYHRNEYSVWPIGMKLQGLAAVMDQLEDPLRDRTFGGMIQGAGLTKRDRWTLASARPQKRQEAAIHVLTAQTATPETWCDQLRRQAERVDAQTPAAAWQAHVAWWQAFWQRSWVRLHDAPLLTLAPEQTTSISPIPLRLGADANGQTRFRGFFARARLYARALSESEIAALAQDPQAGPPEGAVGDWPLDQLENGRVRNRAGAGLEAKVTGQLEVAEHAGRRAARFDGGGFLEIDRDPRLDLTRACTLEAWVAPATIGGEGARLIDKSPVGTDEGYLLDTFPGSSLRLITKSGTLTHAANLKPGEWVHLAATFGAGTKRLYVNGRSVASAGMRPEMDRRELATLLTRAYQLQRWMNACAGRGGAPIKFNGSIFTVEPKFIDGKPFDPDYRAWGGDYWWQNTRLPYWPMLAAGDYDLMQPLFLMYERSLELARQRNRLWYGAQGAFMAETMSFWGMFGNGDYGWQREGKPVHQMDNPYIRHIWGGGLELTMMMLDYYEHTQDEAFLRQRLLPLAEQYLLHFSTRFPRDDRGKILIQPGQALETWQNAVNPMPEVAGLHVVLHRLLTLPAGLVDADRRRAWESMRTILPDLPLKTDQGRTFVLPAGKILSGRGNIENPELYSVFPYRQYQVGKPELDIGLATFERRDIKHFGGWQQNAIQAACLGLTDEARSMLVSNAQAKNPGLRFPVFWGPNYDWVPDQTHGGNLLSTVQSMLLLCDGRRLILFPAWPKDWDVDFKLRAPFQTTVQGELRQGRLVSLRVTPPERRADLVNWLER